MTRTALLALSLALASPALAQSVEFGNDTSDYANNGTCDDRRFVGLGMATDLDEDDNFRDASDCKHFYDLGTITLWSAAEARAATLCSAINFGNDSSDYAKDDECDDARFEGPNVDSIILSEDIGRDATDCRRACERGELLLRNY